MKLEDIISALCSVSAPSGFEQKAQGLIGDMLRPHVDEMKTDALGNLIAMRRSGKPDAKRLLLDAHMDEIGLIVTGYEKGFLRFGKLGGVDPRMLPARELRILAPEPLFGVIDTMPPHVMEHDEMEKAIDPEKLFVDAGLSEAEARRRVPLGTPMVFAGGCEILNERVICGKALDDRACAAIIIKTLENLSGRELGLDLWVLISVQEELGSRGAVTGAFGAAPEYAVALDVTHAWTPDAKKHETMEAGKGPAVAVGPGVDRKLTQAIFSVAEDRGIPVQTEVIPGHTGTDGWVIQVSREGVATALVSLPVKYMHSPVETADLSDAEAAAALLTAFLEKAAEVIT